MGEYGIKIKNIVVGSLLEKNVGVRDHIDMTDAMLCNSLFLDYMTGSRTFVLIFNNSKRIFVVQTEK